MKSDDDTPAIELDSLTRSFGDRLALDRVSLRVDRGEIFGYLGPNGAGKTTTIKILTGLLRPTAGDVRLNGTSVVAEPLRVKERLGYVPESGALFEKLTLVEYLLFTGQMYGIPDDEISARTSYWANLFGLSGEEDRPLGALSRGNRQKVCWAAALLHAPEVLVLDEPLSGLDVGAVMQVKELLWERSAAGKTVFYSSHLVDIVEKLCTRIAVLDRGRLVTTGRVDEVFAAAGATSLEEAMIRLCRDANRAGATAEQRTAGP